MSATAECLRTDPDYYRHSEPLLSASGIGEDQVDLSYLTVAERYNIVNVIKRDLEFRKKSLRNLELSISEERDLQSSQSTRKGTCSCCGTNPKGTLSLRKCRECSHAMCRNCSSQGDRKTDLCKICHKERFLTFQKKDFQSAGQLYGSKLLQNRLRASSLCTSRSSVPRASISELRLENSKMLKVGAATGESGQDRRHSSITDLNSSFTLIKSTDDEESLAEISSIYSEPCYEEQFKIKGKLTFGLWYRGEEETLYIRVVKASGLASIKGKDVNPYVKTYLLPDKSKHTKRKTGIQRRTIKPEFNELLKYKVKREGLDAMTVWLSVWSWDPLGRNRFLGEVTVPLGSHDIDLSESKEEKYALSDEGIAAERDRSRSHGQISIALKYEYPPESRRSFSASPKKESLKPPQTEAQDNEKLVNPRDKSPNQSPASVKKLAQDLAVKTEEAQVNRDPNAHGRLFIRVIKAKNLISMDSAGNTNPFVRTILLPKITVGSRRKTSVQKKTQNPVWKDELHYNFVTLNELSYSRVLEISVWDSDRRGDNSFMGGIRLGPDKKEVGVTADDDEDDDGELYKWLDSTEDEIEHWQDMLANPGQWVERSHMLRSSMKPHSSMEELQSSIEELQSSMETPHQAMPEKTTVNKPELSILVNDVKQEEQGIGSTKPVPDSPTQQLRKLQELNLNRAKKSDHYLIQGKVILGLKYEEGNLVVKVHGAQDLSAVSGDSSNPYIKLYLLPDRKIKKKTTIVKKRLDPTYNETLIYDDIPMKVLLESILWITVWSYEGYFHHNLFLGEVCIHLDAYDFEGPYRELSYALDDYTRLKTVPESSAFKKRGSTIYKVRTNRAKYTPDVSSMYGSSSDLAKKEEETTPGPPVDSSGQLLPEPSPHHSAPKSPQKSQSTPKKRVVAAVSTRPNKSKQVSPSPKKSESTGSKSSAEALI